MKNNRSNLNHFFAIIVMTLIAGGLIVYGLQRTPYHSQSTGVTIKNYSQFTGNTPGTGEYKAIKGKYIMKAWVPVKEGPIKVANS